MKIYEVGGSIRDRLLGIESSDIDYAVEAESYEAMRQGLLDLGYEFYLEKPEYFTIRAWHRDNFTRGYDFVLCRKESAYYDGRHPESVEVGTIYDDLARRDFTVNAIARDIETDEIIDPFNGQDDIANRTIRCVGSTEDRMNEDALRMIRAIRFAITKNMNLSSELIYFLDNNHSKLLSQISIDRIREELSKCFKYDTYQTLRALHRFANIEAYLFGVNKQIWLLPTTKER